MSPLVSETPVGDRSAKQRVRERRSARWRRVQRHVALAAATATGLAVVYQLVAANDAIYRVSMATAYVALALFAVTLSFGPIAALRGRRYPVSTHLRRDMGIWSGLVALAHVVAGLQVHLRGKMEEYFVTHADRFIMPRIDAFGFANYSGLVAGIIFLALLLTSNDISLRRLGTERWRRLHTLATWAFALTVAHGVAYQLIEKRAVAFVVAFGTMVVVISALRSFRTRRPPAR